MRSLASARLKRSRAVELLAEGFCYDGIARQVGFTSRGSAHRAVSKALSERQVENIDLLRALEGNRLDMLQAAVWDRAMAGDLRAINTVVNVIGCRIRLFALDQWARDGGNPERPGGLVVGPVEGDTGRGNRISIRFRGHDDRCKGSRSARPMSSVLGRRLVSTLPRVDFAVPAGPNRAPGGQVHGSPASPYLTFSCQQHQGQHHRRRHHHRQWASALERPRS